MDDKRFDLLARRFAQSFRPAEIDCVGLHKFCIEFVLANEVRVNSRSGFQRAAVTGAISTLQSALLRQKGPLPRFRDSSSYAEAEIVVLHKLYECTRCGKPMRSDCAKEQPRYIRALRRSQARKAQTQIPSAQETCNTVEREAQ